MPSYNSYRRKRSKRVVRVPAGSSADERMAKLGAWEKADEGEQTVYEEAQDAGSPPPQSGKGSGVQAWHDYAVANDVEVSEDASRADVIAALTEADVPTE